MSDDTKPRKLSEAEQDTIRQQVLELCRQEDITRKQVAAEAGIPYGTVTPFLGGTYAGDGSRIAEALSRWMTARVKRQQVRGTVQAARFIPTPTADAIMAALQHAQHMPDMVVITGAPGTGKSSAACEYTRQNPQVHKLVADPSINSVRSLLNALANLLGTYDAHSQYRVCRAIHARLIGTGALLIIDEAQHLSSAMLDQLRSFHDQANIGIALVGNEAIVGRLEGGRKSAEFAQLYSRVGMRLKRPKPLRGDVDALLDAWGVEAGTAREQLRAVARYAGGLRNLSKCHRLAQMIAANEGGTLTAEHVQLAWERLGATPAVVA